MHLVECSRKECIRVGKGVREEYIKGKGKGRERHECELTDIDGGEKVFLINFISLKGMSATFICSNH